MRRLAALMLTVTLFVLCGPALAGHAAASRCTSSVAFPRIELGPRVHSAQTPTGDERYAALTATRNGLWAGYAYDDFTGVPRVAVITWREGRKKARVVRTYNFAKSFAAANYLTGSVHIAGISPAGAVVWSVQDDTHRASIWDTEGYALAGGRIRALAHPRSWASVHPLGVATNGTVVGWIRSATGRYYIVTWRHYSSPPVVGRYLGKSSPDLMSTDAHGDIVWSSRTGHDYARLASGRVVALGSGFQLGAQGGRYAWLSSGTDLDRFDLAAGKTTATVVADPYNEGPAPVTGGPHGEIAYTGDDPSVERFRDAAGHTVTLHHVQNLFGLPGSAVDTHGSLSYTYDSGYVHVAHCA